MGDWGLGNGDWAQSPIPNPQSPIPNPQSPLLIFLFNKIINKIKKYLKCIIIKQYYILNYVILSDVLFKINIF